jgi:hypothetical protein
MEDYMQLAGIPVFRAAVAFYRHNFFTPVVKLFPGYSRINEPIRNITMYLL